MNNFVHTLGLNSNKNTAGHTDAHKNSKTRHGAVGAVQGSRVGAHPRPTATHCLHGKLHAADEALSRPVSMPRSRHPSATERAAQSSRRSAGVSRLLRVPVQTKGRADQRRCARAGARRSCMRSAPIGSARVGQRESRVDMNGAGVGVAAHLSPLVDDVEDVVGPRV